MAVALASSGRAEAAACQNRAAERGALLAATALAATLRAQRWQDSALTTPTGGKTSLSSWILLLSQLPSRPGMLIGAGLVLALLAAAWLCRRLALRRSRPPFQWIVLTDECKHEFVVGGRWRDTVEKRGDYGHVGLVIPVNGRIEVRSGNVYRWALVIEQVNRERPEIQFGIQGTNFELPWRLVTSTRCSRSRDDEEQWTRRPGGDRMLQAWDVVHLELNLRQTPGVLAMAINEESFEVVFSDIPTSCPIMPAVMLGGHGSRVRVQATRRSWSS
eukprot:TRINITY_DN95559_c0_g1_i1.p1 TRINITY_DN95559_c0_g1~~TRINITY_DN95559_c0_g1_i1.p1  ORF type:complete len:282 (+),score=27.06 TRINITY_DN95559_c0_g1_i1:25-846(+)